MEDAIRGSVKFWRRNGHWQSLVEGPEWVVKEVVQEARQRGLHILNYGGASGSSVSSMLIGTSAGGFDPSEQEPAAGHAEARDLEAADGE